MKPWKRPWTPLSRRQLAAILADTEQDVPDDLYSASDVYRLAREVEEYRQEHIRRVRELLRGGGAA